MAANIKHLSSLTALTLAVSPAYAEETQNVVRPHNDANSSVCQAEQGSTSTVSSGPVRVRVKDINIASPELVAISSPRLAYEVAFRPHVAVDLLSEVSPINLDEIALDENCRVVVRNEEFITKLRHETSGANYHEKPELSPQENNGICGVGC